jgi:hypothetical protein
MSSLSESSPVLSQYIYNLPPGFFSLLFCPNCVTVYSIDYNSGTPSLTVWDWVMVAFFFIAFVGGIVFFILKIFGKVNFHFLSFFLLIFRVFSILEAEKASFLRGRESCV